MNEELKRMLDGYHKFREKYADGDSSIMQYLSHYGQQPKAMVVSCCDSRVDPALILQCDPGDLFVVRNVANIIPPFEKDTAHHGTSAALEFGVRFLKVNHLVLLGHSQCGGIQALINSNNPNEPENDFITSWVNLIKTEETKTSHIDECAKQAIKQSYKNCLTFPWLKEKIDAQELFIHLWFFNIKSGEIFAYSEKNKEYLPLK